jgi:hypothetical protein
MKLILIISTLLLTMPATAAELKVVLSVTAPKANCKNGIKGLINAETVRLSAAVEGARGNVIYRFWHSNDGFKMPPKNNTEGFSEVTERKTSNARVELQLPALREDISRLHVTFGVAVQDSQGNVGSAFQRMRVTRNLIFERDAKNPNPVCYQTYVPHLISSQYVNQNDTDLSLTVSQSEQRMNEDRTQKGASWSFSPSLFVGNVVFSFFSYQRAHFRALASNLSESVYITVENTLNPGDVGELYMQQTRLMYPHTVSQLDSCRNELPSGIAFVDSWQRNYNLIKKDPTVQEIGNMKNVGTPVANTCADLESTLVKQDFFGR